MRLLQIALFFLVMFSDCWSSSLSVKALYTPQQVSETMAAACYYRPSSIVLSSSDNALEVTRVDVDGVSVWENGTAAYAESPSIVWLEIVSIQNQGNKLVFLSILPREQALLLNSVVKVFYRKNQSEKSESLSFTLPGSPTPVEWRGITFSNGLRRMWFGLTNHSESRLELSSVLVNGEEHMGRMVSKPRVLPPRRCTVFGVDLSEAVPQGANLIVVCRTGAGFDVVGRARADDALPIGDLSGKVKSDFGFDAECVWAHGYSIRPCEHSRRMLMECPTHRHGSISESIGVYPRTFRSVPWLHGFCTKRPWLYSCLQG